MGRGAKGCVIIGWKARRERVWERFVGKTATGKAETILAQLISSLLLVMELFFQMQP